MDTVGDLLARERRSDRPALVIGDRERSYHELITNAYKAGNVLGYHGVGGGRPLADAPVRALAPVLAFLGAAQLGAATRFDPAAGVDAGDRMVLVPAAEQADYDPPAGTKLAVFGGEPADPETINWEESVWSENPAFPPTNIDPQTPLLLGGGSDNTVSHRAALSAAETVVDRYGLDADSRIVLRSSLGDPGAVVAGLLAPLTVGGVAVLADPAASVSESRGNLAVSSGDAPEPDRIDPTSVPFSND
jgi:hypothetical protein